MRGFVLTCYCTLFGVILISFWVVNTLLDNSHIDLLKLRYHNICTTLKLNAFPSPLHVEEHLHGQCWKELEEEIIRKVTSRLLIFITTLVQGVSNFMWESWCFQHRNHLVSRVPSYDPVSEVEDMGANLYFCCTVVGNNGRVRASLHELKLTHPSTYQLYMSH